jgi:hypothetical protein
MGIDAIVIPGVGTCLLNEQQVSAAALRSRLLLRDNERCSSMQSGTF